MIKSAFPPIDLSILPNLALAALVRFVEIAEFDAAGADHAAFADDVRREICRRYVNAHGLPAQFTSPPPSIPDVFNFADMMAATTLGASGMVGAGMPAKDRA